MAVRTRGKRHFPVEVMCLGRGDAFHHGGLASTSFLVSHRRARFLVDCGPTTLLRLHQLGIDPRGIDAAFVTHFHGDHVGGVPFVLLYRAVMGSARRSAGLSAGARSAKAEARAKADPLVIVGPRGIDDRVESLYRLQYAEISQDAHRGARRYHELYPGQRYSLSVGGVRVVVHAMAMAHKPESLGYRFHLGGAVLAFTGDTGWTPRLRELCEGADLFAVDCTSRSGRGGMHLSLEEIYEHRREFPARRLWLVHTGHGLLERFPRSLPKGWSIPREGATLKLSQNEKQKA